MKAPSPPLDSVCVADELSRAPDELSRDYRRFSNVKPTGAIVHIPTGSRLDMLERQFFVGNVSATAIVCHVGTLPDGFAEGREVGIFDGSFRVHRIAPEYVDKKNVYRVVLTPMKGTKINPRPLAR